MSEWGNRQDHQQLEIERLRADLASAQERLEAYEMDGASAAIAVKAAEAQRDALRERINSWHIKIEKLDDEVTTIRAQLDAAEKELAFERIKASGAMTGLMDKMAELAARDELLKEARDFIIHHGQGDFHTINNIVERIDAALKGGDCE